MDGRKSVKGDDGMRFNKGDRVMICKPSPRLWTNNMFKLIGKCGTILEGQDSEGDCRVHIDGVYDFWHVNEESLLLVSKFEPVSIEINETVWADGMSRLNYDIEYDGPGRLILRPKDGYAQGEVNEESLTRRVMASIVSSCPEDDIEIEHIWSNPKNGCTTVEFADGEKITVKRAEDEEDDLYFAVASALAEKVYGSNTRFKRIIKEKTTILKKREK